MSTLDSSGSSGYQHPAHARPAPPPGPPWYSGAPTGPPPAPPSPVPSMPYSGLIPPARVAHVVRGAGSAGPPPPAAPPPPPPASSSHSHSHTAAAAAAQEAVLWPYRGHCASFHNFCYYFLQIFFIGAAMAGVALVLADAFFRQRWPHVHGLLFIGVLLVFVSAVMLFVLCQRGAGARGGAEQHGAKDYARAAEAIPLRDVAAVYVQPGLATLRRQQLPPPPPHPHPQADAYAESEYSHPWDQVTGVSSRPDMSEVCSMGTLNSRGRPPGPRHWQ